MVLGSPDRGGTELPFAATLATTGPAVASTVLSRRAQRASSLYGWSGRGPWLMWTSDDGRSPAAPDTRPTSESCSSYSPTMRLSSWRIFVGTAAPLAVGALLTACGSPSSSSPSSTDTTPPTTATSGPSTTTVAKPVSNLYCGTKSGKPTTSKLLVIYEENKDSSSIYGSPSAPNIDRYAADCGSAQNFQALTHPSLPNYLASTSGVSYASDPWTGDCDPGGTCLTGNDNIFHQVGASGWKAYAESMSSNCQTGSSDPYAAKHNPALYYTDVSSQCPTNDVPMGTTAAGSLHNDVVAGTLPTFSTMTCTTAPSSRPTPGWPGG